MCFFSSFVCVLRPRALSLHLTCLSYLNFVSSTYSPDLSPCMSCCSSTTSLHRGVMTQRYTGHNMFDVKVDSLEASYI